MEYSTSQIISEDIPNLAILFDQYRVFYGKQSDVPTATSFLNERFINQESVVFVTHDANGVLVGFTQLYPLFSSTRMKRLFLLNDLFVLAERRGEGVSKMLIDSAKAYCITQGGCGLILETAKSNEIGNKLYPSCGFELDEDHNYYSWDA